MVVQGSGPSGTDVIETTSPSYESALSRICCTPHRAEMLLRINENKHLTARLNRPSSHNDMTSMKNVMLEDDGRRAGAETKTPAEVAENIKKKPPARLHRGTCVAQMLKSAHDQG